MQPPSILCIGKNYKAHIEEFKSQTPAAPILFIKAANSLHDPGAPVPLPKPELTTQIDYEAELAVVIGRPTRNVPEAKAWTMFLAIPAPTTSQLVIGQGRTMGAWKVAGWLLPNWLLDETELDPADLRIEGRTNGAVMQSSRTSMLIFRCRI